MSAVMNADAGTTCTERERRLLEESIGDAWRTGEWSLLHGSTVWEFWRRLAARDAAGLYAMLGKLPSGQRSVITDRLRLGETGNGGEASLLARIASSPRAIDVGLIVGESEQSTLLNRASAQLRAVRPDVPVYPVEALGEILGDACGSLAIQGQVDPAMAGQSLLAAAALLCQSRADVRTLAGVKPLSMYLLTIGLSADGKSTADGVAVAPIEQYQRERTRVHKESSEVAFTLRGKKGETVTLPADPYLLMRDPTIEGVRHAFANGQPSQGAFTSEAGAVLAGYGMSADNRIKTAAGFNGLWDNGELSASRAMSGRLQLYDRRLAIHWLVQPDAARTALNDVTLSNIGFWPRFIVAWPDPLPPRRAELSTPVEF